MVNLSDGLDLKTYMSLYMVIHNFCTAQKAVGQSNLSSTHRGGEAR
jgi:cullin 1